MKGKIKCDKCYCEIWFEPKDVKPLTKEDLAEIEKLDNLLKMKLEKCEEAINRRILIPADCSVYWAAEDARNKLKLKCDSKVLCPACNKFKFIYR